MKLKLSLLIMFAVFPLGMQAQQIGELAPEKPMIKFPPNTAGVDLLFGEGGFGLGGFYRRSINNDMTFFTDLSFSEAKDDKEVEYIDYYGNTYTPGKKNRLYVLPVYVGLQCRLFSDEMTDNLRPYINAAVGPTMVITTPYEKEFFSAFGKAESYYAAGAYIGIGANIGIDQKSVFGINLRYYFVRFLKGGVESLEGYKRSNLDGFYITINIGSMF